MIIDWARARYRRAAQTFADGGLIEALVGVMSDLVTTPTPTPTTTTVDYSVRVEAALAFPTFTDLIADVLGAGGLQIAYGIGGNKPDDCVAGTGQLQYTLDNSETNSAAVLGYYSPAHALKRAGWNFGIPTRVTFIHNSISYVKFYGKVRNVMPEPGTYGTRRVRVTAYDTMRDLAESDVREVALQINKSEDELLNAVLDAVPAENQPIARNFDAGVDMFPVALDNLQGGVKALGLVRDIVVSAIGYLFSKGDGTLRYLTRHAVATGASQYTFDNDMQELGVPSSLDGVFNRIRVTNHPKVISPAATDELYTLPDGNTIAMAPGETREVWVDYTDPIDRQTKVGGTAVVTLLVGGTHYSANEAEDGTGGDLTAAVTATIEPFSSTAKYTLVASPTVSTFFRVLKVIGEAVRDPGPQTFESLAIGASDRPFDLDLPYQDDPHVAQSAADFIRSIYQSLTYQVSFIKFLADENDERMVQALAREPGDKITISEAVTGITSIVALIQSVSLEVTEEGNLWCTWGLAPANSVSFWQWGIVGYSEWGVTTIYGF